MRPVYTEGAYLCEDEGAMGIVLIEGEGAMGVVLIEGEGVLCTQGSVTIYL
jgi:hypothetical protein